MPRHRRERVPSHRALRHAGNPARRARVTPAVNASIAVLFDSATDDPDAADTVPLRPPPRHFRANTRVDAHSVSSDTGVLRTAARGLLVTPWFAAASGFVIAASLWIYAPHAKLQFPNGSANQSQQCIQHCPPASSNKDSGRLATSGKGRLAQPRKSGSGATGPHRAAGSSRSAVSGLTFSYYLLRSEHGFSLMLTVVGQHPIKDWQLSFALRGDRIRKVLGADWKRTSPHSGTASGDGQQQLWPGSGQGDGDQSGSGHHQYGFTLLVSGAGPPVGPTSCVYNGQSCVFTNGRPGPS
jgi:hypothetical protein